VFINSYLNVKKFNKFIQQQKKRKRLHKNFAGDDARAKHRVLFAGVRHTNEPVCNGQ
jgi:hypothetical protein